MDERILWDRGGVEGLFTSIAMPTPWLMMQWTILRAQLDRVTLAGDSP